jgi:hypothetical protein
MSAPALPIEPMSDSVACVVAGFATHVPPQPHAQETRER